MDNLQLANNSYQPFITFKIFIIYPLYRNNDQIMLVYVKKHTFLCEIVGDFRGL